MTNNKKYLLLLLTVFTLIYLLLTWLPQYLHHTFIPAVFNEPLSKLGMDLYADVVAAKLMGMGLSARFIPINDPSIYPYSIGGITHPYGALTIIAMYPFRNINFHTIQITWFFLSIFILIFLTQRIFTEMLDGEKSLYKLCYLLIGFSVLLIFSGPINLLLERGQLEILIPFLLYFFWRGYRHNQMSLKSALALGLAVHIKLWPIMLTILLFKKGYYKYFLMALLMAFLPDILLNPWLPITDWLHALQQFSNTVAMLLIGGINDAFYSWFVILKWPVHWKIWSISFWSLSAIFLWYQNCRLAKTLENNDLCFAFAIIASLLSPEYFCDYNLVITLLLIPALIHLRQQKLTVILLALLLSNLLAFHLYAGPIKASVLLVLFGLIVFHLIKKHHPKKSS